MKNNDTNHANSRLAISRVVSEVMENIIDNVTVVDPFDAEKHKFKKPLYAALIPDEIFRGSHFERRFVTPFGNLWEKMAKVLAIELHGS